MIQKAGKYQVVGLVVLGGEGFNTTLAAKNEKNLNQFTKDIRDLFATGDLIIKKSQTHKTPFRKFVVKVRKEIVTLGRPEFVPKDQHCHLSPKKWHEMIEKQDVVLVDVRNHYEHEVGSFKEAIKLNIRRFSEFPDKVSQLKSDRKKPHLIFCTGGIRCEKAIYEMQSQGFKNVHQLEGGILSYIERYPEGYFEGECFVFDSRVCLDKNLNTSKNYSLCPHCGGVSTIGVRCRKCDEPSKLCKTCKNLAEQNPEYETCSRNCRYHYLRDPSTKGPQQKQFYHY